MEIPQTKIDWLSQIAQIQGIPLDDLKKYYDRHLNDPTYITAFPKDEDRLDYIDTLMSTHIQEFHGAVLTEYEIVVIVSTPPKESKAGNMYNNHVVMARIPGANNTFKWMNIINNEDTGKVERIEPLSMGLIKVNVKNEDDRQIEAFSRPNTEFVPKHIDGLPQDILGKKEWMKKTVRPFTIQNAAQNLSAKTNDNKGTNPCSLRWIQGTISQHRIIKKTDEKTGKEKTTGIINITDKTAALIPDFGKPKTIPDPKDPSKTITDYGGFGGFADPEDIINIGKGSECIFVGTLSSARTMNIGTILPILVIPPKKSSERLHKPNTGVVNAPIAGAIDASVNPATL